MALVGLVLLLDSAGIGVYDVPVVLDGVQDVTKHAMDLCCPHVAQDRGHVAHDEVSRLLSKQDALRQLHRLTSRRTDAAGDATIQHGVFREHRTDGCVKRRVGKSSLVEILVKHVFGAREVLALARHG